MKNYRVNADLSRFCTGLRIVELVEHRLMRNLKMSVERHRHLHIGKQAFLSHSLRFICDIHEVLLKLYFSLNFSSIPWFLFKGKFKKLFEMIGKHSRAVFLAVLSQF